MNKNRIAGAAEQGEQAKDCEALVIKARRCKSGGCAAWAHDDKSVIAVRVCDYKKTVAQTLAAQEAIHREATKKRRDVRPETLEAAAYVIVLTKLMQPSAPDTMDVLQATMADRAVIQERPEAGQSRPPPAGVKQSGKATFA